MGSHTQTMGIMLVVMLSINIGLALFQTGVDSYGQTTSDFFNVTDTPYMNYVDGGIIDGKSMLNESFLLEETSSTESDGGFWEIVKTINKWVRTSPIGTALNFVTSVITQPAGFFRDVGIPSPVALGFQTIWAIIFILTLIAFIMGR